VIVQDNLIGMLLRAALEETGARRGLLILSRSGEPRIAAEATRRHETVVVRLRDVVVSESLLPESLLHYVQHTQESVVIDNVDARARFVTDPYLHRHKTEAILGLPLLHQAKLVGVLILENDLTSGVFTPARITVLKLVASLAASALETSRSYSDLQKREAKIRRLVDANIIGIYIVDLGGPILESNDAYLRMLGYDRRDIVSGRLRWTDLTPPEWHAADKRRVERVRRIGHLQPFEKEFFRKDGTRVPVLLGVARFKEPRNEAVVFALDMSKQKRTEAIALETRTIEHMRIARKSYNVLLQNFQGMMFRFQAARSLMIRRPEEGLLSLNDAINAGEKALEECRDAIRDFAWEGNGDRSHISKRSDV
jgi:PAS domain S-box-containing protein